MAISDYQAILFPLLRHTSDGEIHIAREPKDTFVDYLGITPEETLRIAATRIRDDLAAKL